MASRLASIIKAAQIVDNVFIRIKPHLQAGIKEIEIAQLIKKLLKEYHSERLAFKTIVASGKRAALPHGHASEKVINNGNLVVIDFGAVYNGFCSDITRTIVIGQPNKKQVKVYNIVKRAQTLAVKKLKPGMKINEIDRAAREYIFSQGYGKYFIHTTGHGVGKRVHVGPKISRRNKRKLKEGMVITIEPGIYIENWGGVRIEDMYLITNNGYQLLSKSERNIKL